ncbi:metallophosphoesterase [Asaia krungthepensis]|uniref:Phosphohydrolase n=1 Tax=Asaia krungthepensis NRIC 0535 TaxID=1307925 RepID=A0ABQ0Q3C2_9PROT|nr:metallophosphoesterase [Asaia krungthepensis]GBQ89435.1 putative phosphohydrolase [Asaia krungthepensis NRIC 0535]
MRPVVFGTLFLIVILNWLWPLPVPLAARITGAFLIVVAGLYHYWCRLSSGSVFAPEMPRLVVILFNWGFGALGFITVMQLAVDIGAAIWALVTWHPFHIGTEPRVAVGIIAALLSAWGVANALRVPPVRDVTLRIAALPPGFEGYRLVQLTDLHITRLFPRLWAEKVVKKANEAMADLVVVTGDFIDGSVAMRRDDVAPLSALQAPDGVWAIPGNHEYFFDYGEWIAHLSNMGFRFLLNRHEIIRRGDEALVLAGVTDRSAAHHGEEGPDLALALAGRPDDAPVILLDHQPAEAREAARLGVALQLSGHTHGGMIYGLDALVARGNKGFVSGLYHVGNMALYVSNGTGIWPGFALRLGRPSEITRFTLTAR